MSSSIDRMGRGAWDVGRNRPCRRRGAACCPRRRGTHVRTGELTRVAIVATGPSGMAADASIDGVSASEHASRDAGGSKQPPYDDKDDSVPRPTPHVPF